MRRTSEPAAQSDVAAHADTCLRPLDPWRVSRYMEQLTAPRHLTQRRLASAAYLVGSCIGERISARRLGDGASDLPRARRGHPERGGHLRLERDGAQQAERVGLELPVVLLSLLRLDRRRKRRGGHRRGLRRHRHLLASRHVGLGLGLHLGLHLGLDALTIVEEPHGAGVEVVPVALERLFARTHRKGADGVRQLLRLLPARRAAQLTNLLLLRLRSRGASQEGCGSRM
eukprot:4261990-Pleurochrysis_carterae.AAC.3